MVTNADSFEWRDRPVLVTGASGLVGGALTRRLVEAGADVVALVRDWVPSCELMTEGLLSRVTVVRGDICDYALMERILGEYEIQVVFHLAAQTIVGIANRNPLSTFEANIKGTWNVLEACRHAPTVRQIILASSDKAYGEQAILPYDEQMPLIGRQPYDVSKSCADLIAQAYAHTYGLPVVVTRCGNFYGPGDLNWNRIIPGTIRSVLRGERPLIRSDGHFIRDYFFVEDGAAAYMTLAAHLARHPEIAGNAYNFSNEIQVTVLDLVQRILTAMDSDLEPRILNKPFGEIRQQYLSAARARNELDWKPLYTLDEGLGLTIPWYKNHLEYNA
ncbi:NAD-dependent epimerase/dehydratase [Gluconacetobacter johannae DSM 13595]|uniref:NAD-dependent epimerase/dehydratase family protein n=2 Tax=Gluconacetobacter johannae TaxID=112140 RepID=A0A7W4P3Q9_9PROT|nr:NAD-dependent epimerase/dehydratase family protein [Gluconacetobacter johannae]MBB2176114.1 NAD-dependent epimerase/dehydratase family protein [Gluconacetobacter johannae]GBQ85699.1 NAD-dependent epimerase/dehydratase [Gluconacetobacter johannae DSM 13595]